MKKLILSAAMMAGVGALASQAAMAADGTITLNGTISAVTCSVHGGTPTGGSNFTVTLPTVASTAFPSVGSVAGAMPYTITVGAASEGGCTDGTKVRVLYEPTSPNIDAATGNLKVAGGATGVQLQLLNGGDRSVIKLNAASPASTQVTVASNTAALPFYAQYVSTAASVTAGQANSSVQYSIQYN
jgi:major type 1 subunit fimbrin (pilin)